MKFNKIVAIDPCGLTGETVAEIKQLAKTDYIEYTDCPENNEEIIRRISDADCVLVSWRTPIDAAVIRSCPSVKYIGMCCSLYDEQSANVDIAEARKNGIVVKGVRDYGDEGTVEFIFAQLICLMKGMGEHQWKEEPTELTGKTIGIIGMGVLGKMITHTALCFGMKVIYNSRTRKPEVENENVTYLPLSNLLSEADIVTVHVPRNAITLTDEHFSLMKKEGIFINTSLGQPFEKEALLKWIEKGSSNYAIFDASGYSNLKDEFEKYNRILLTHKSSGFTHEAKIRLTNKVYQNMLSFLES